MSDYVIKDSFYTEEKVVYHYCSLSALYGIVQNKSLWLTSLSSSNDAKELEISKTLIKRAIEEIIEENKFKEYKEILCKIINAPEDTSYKKHRPKYKYFGISFVNDKDNLTHWARYGDGLKGVSIGVNISMIRELFEAYDLPKIVTSWIHWVDISYDEKNQINIIKNHIMAKMMGLDIEDIKRNDIITSAVYYTTLAQTMPMFKHRSFVDEKEYRIYFEEGECESQSSFYNGEFYTDNPELFKNISKHLLEISELMRIRKEDKCFNMFGSGIRSYYNVYFEKIWSKNFIKEIVLGPHCYQNKEEIREFLKFNGLTGTKIITSKIPIR